MHWLGTFLKKLFSIRDQQEADVQKPFLEHLEDLRVTLFKMAFATLLGMVAAFLFNQWLFNLAVAPASSAQVQIVGGNITDSIMITFKLSFYGGLVLAFPLLLYFVAEFVLPALTRKEKRLLIPGVVIGFVLFLGGVVIAYDFVLFRTIEWLANYSRSKGIQPLLQAGTYFGFVTHLLVACGLLCELPIVVIALSLMGVVSYQLLSRTRAYAIVLIGILVAILAPSPDPIMFLTMAAPVVAVYELCIWIVWAIERRQASRPAV